MGLVEFVVVLLLSAGLFCALAIAYFVRSKWMEESYVYKKKRNNEEHLHQKALIDWRGSVLHKYPELEWLFAIPNGGYRNWSVGKTLKEEGTKPGVSDLFLPIARGKYHGFFIEMKAGEGKASESQYNFATFVLKQGYKAGIYWDWIDAKEAILTYLATGE